jgi:GxxExxY protein
MDTVINIATDIYNALGPGYNEVIYHKAFEVALRLQNITYQSEVITPIFYKGHNVGHGRVDLLINNNLILELKAIANLSNDSFVQIKNYMKHYNISEGLIINFGQPTKASCGDLSIKYLVINETSNRTFNFTNGSFIELVQKPISNEMNVSI